MMTPQEVASCTFTKAVMGGYNMAAVDDFLDKLTEDYSALHKDNAALKAKIKVLVDKMEEYREMEDAMRSTLLTAQKMAGSIVAEAEAKRDAIVADAASGSKVRLAEIEQELAQQEQRLIQVRADVDRQIEAEQKRLALAQEELRSFIAKVQSACTKHLQLLEELPELPVAPVAPVKEEPQMPVQEEKVDTVLEELPAHVDQQIETSLEKELEDVFAAFDKETEDADDMGDLADIFAQDAEEDEEDASATRVLNLDDLQFGRNYTKD